MELEFEQPNAILRNSRTPKVDIDVAVRVSLLSDSTSGIVKGEEDDPTSVGSSSFSSPDLDTSQKERASTVVSKDNSSRQHSTASEEETKLLTKKYKDNNLTITENPAHVIKRKDNDLSDDDDDEDKVTIPDGGWGWVVVLSSFVISMIADGISFSFGLLYIEFLDEFEASKSTTAWIGSLFIAVPLLSGPIMSALVDRYGCRSMTILGGIISTLGFVLASISTTLEMMMLTFGVIAGLGLGLVYVTAVVSIAYWFEKKRNLAVGLGACGTGVGTFVYAPLTQYFIEEYGWRGTILLLSGTLLNLCVCGCVMRDPEWWTLEQKRQKKKDDEKPKREVDKLMEEDKKSDNSRSVSLKNYEDFSEIEQETDKRDVIHKSLTPVRARPKIQRQENIKVYMENINSNKQKSESMINIPTYLTFDDESSLATIETLNKFISSKYGVEVKCPSFEINRTPKQKPTSPDQEKSVHLQVEDNSPPVVTFNTLSVKRTHSEKYDEKKEKTYKCYKLKNPQQGVVIQKKPEENKELVKQDSKENKRVWLKKQLSVNHHYLKDLKMPITSISHRNAMLNTNKYRLKASSCPDIFKNSMITINDKEEVWYEDCVSCFADMFNVSLFKKITFNLLCLGTIILFIWFIVPYFYLAEHMTLRGYNEDDGAFMLSLIGITNTIGMVGLGWIGDFPQVSIGNLYAVCLVFCGATVATIPLAVYNYWFLVTISAAFGLLFAASFTFTPSLLVKLVSLDDFTSAYGLVLLAQGIGHLIGPPLSGLIFDLTLSWELSFYLAGGWIIVAGVLISFIQPVRVYQERRELLMKRGSHVSLA